MTPSASFVDDEYCTESENEQHDEIEEEMSGLLHNIKRRDTKYKLDAQEIDDGMDASGLAETLKKKSKADRADKK